ncbi:hypothetical protein [Microbacterium sp.]|uniref:hypothetical protein n=1 Tax=Microbacterium sp. TaxID=51671 RepID=UPI0028121E7C|nr:hypothetical protein [Microbacterium sp.]
MRDDAAVPAPSSVAAPHAPSDAAAIAEWTALLDRFERDVAGPSDAAWREASAPLPFELAGRAQTVLAAQREAIARTARDRDEVLGQLTAVRRIPSAPATAAAYIDLDG